MGVKATLIVLFNVVYCCISLDSPSRGLATWMQRKRAISYVPAGLHICKTTVKVVIITTLGQRQKSA